MDIATGANGTVFCTSCGQKLSPNDRFCPECGTPRPTPPPPYDPPEFTSSLTTASTLGSFTGAPPMTMSLAPASSDSSAPMLQYDVEYPERLSRLLIFVKWLLIIPHAIVLMFVYIALYVVSFVAFFAILITGKYPRGMWEFSLGVIRWTANVNAYMSLQRDEYPPFSSGDDYPVRLELDYPRRLSRLLIFVKWLFVIPSVFIYLFVALIASFAMFLALFAILITGRYPRGLFDFVTGSFRWVYRIRAYFWLLTDAYPPFRMSP